MKKPDSQNCTVTFKRFAFKRLNTGRFPVTIETLEKVENSVYWTSNDFIKVSLIRTQGHKVLVFGLTTRINPQKSNDLLRALRFKKPLVDSKLSKKNLIACKKWVIPCTSQEHNWTMPLKAGSCKTKISKAFKNYTMWTSICFHLGRFKKNLKLLSTCNESWDKDKFLTSSIRKWCLSTSAVPRYRQTLKKHWK